MTIPPSILIVRVSRFPLWLPLFLIWPLVAALWIGFLPLLMTVAILTGRRRWLVPLLILGPSIYRVFAAFRGTTIDVHNGNQKIYVAFR